MAPVERSRLLALLIHAHEQGVPEVEQLEISEVSLAGRLIPLDWKSEAGMSTGS